MQKIGRLIIYIIMLVMVPLSCYAKEYKLVYPIADNSTSYELPSSIQDVPKEKLNGFVYKGIEKDLFLISAFVIVDKVSDSAPNNLEEYDKSSLGVLLKSDPLTAVKSNAVTIKNIKASLSDIDGELAIVRTYDHCLALKTDLPITNSMEVVFLKNGKWYVFAYHIEVGKIMIAMKEGKLNRKEFDRMFQEIGEVLKHSINSIRIDSIFAK